MHIIFFEIIQDNYDYKISETVLQIILIKHESAHFQHTTGRFLTL